MSIESICNESLDLIGYKRHITSIWDGSKAARIALNAWAETRDALLTKQQPRWAKRDDELALVRSAPQPWGYAETAWNSTSYPDLPWLYEYELPDDCLVPLQLKPRLLTLPNWRPRPVSFRYKRNGVDGRYTVLTNQADAILTCIYSVRNPAMWEMDFVEALVQILAKKFEAGLGTRPPQRQQQEQQDANAA